VALLLENGADVTATDAAGSTAFVWAAKEGHSAIAAVIRNAMPKEPPATQKTQSASPTTKKK
jgi:ankyrin repeat protein